MALPAKQFATGTLRTVGGLREAIQDLVTPDLKAVKTTTEALSGELKLRTESLSHELKIRNESLQENLSKEIFLRTENLREELRLRDTIQSSNILRLEVSHAQMTDAIRDLARKIDAMNLDLRERVATLEARLPRQ